MFHILCFYGYILAYPIKKLYNTKKIVDSWLDLLEVGYIIVFLSSYRYICDQLYVANYMLYIILLYRFKVLWTVQFIRSKTIEPVVQPVPNGWTSEPVNRQPHRFDVRSGPNNYGLDWLIFIHIEPLEKILGILFLRDENPFSHVLDLKTKKKI